MIFFFFLNTLPIILFLLCTMLVQLVGCETLENAAEIDTDQKQEQS